MRRHLRLGDPRDEQTVWMHSPANSPYMRQALHVSSPASECSPLPMMSIAQLAAYRMALRTSNSRATIMTAGECHRVEGSIL